MRPDIDQTLLILLLLFPDETFTGRELAEICECSRNVLFEAEKAGLRKARQKLRNQGF